MKQFFRNNPPILIATALLLGAVCVLGLVVAFIAPR